MQVCHRAIHIILFLRNCQEDEANNTLGHQSTLSVRIILSMTHSSNYATGETEMEQL